MGIMQPYDFQKKILKDLEPFNRCAIYADMGLGKTLMGSLKAQQLDAPVTLVICQKSKIQDWMDHFEENHPEVFAISLRRDKMTAADIQQLVEKHGKVVCIINYDLMWRRPELLKLKNFTLMLDESSLIQNHTAKRTKFILKMKPENVILLSGTPTGGRYERLWTQLHLLGWEISRKLYEQTYVIWDYIDSPYIDYRIPIVKGYKNVDRLKRKMAEHGCIFLKTDDAGVDLPEQQNIIIRVNPSSDYRKFMKQRYLKLSDGTELIGDTSLTSRLYARMLCGHYNKDKISAVHDLIESTDDRLIIFYNWNAELDVLKDLCTKCDKPVSVVNGSVKDLTAYEQNSDSITLIQYQAGAFGLNLQKCKRIIYFTLPESSELFEQSKKRIHRIGQEQTCFYYYPICTTSVEIRILDALKQRRDYNDRLFKKDFE